MEIESLYKCQFASEMFDDSFFGDKIIEKKLREGVTSGVEFFDIFGGGFELLDGEDLLYGCCFIGLHRQ